MKQIAVSVPDDILLKIDAEARNEGISRSDVVRRILIRVCRADGRLADDPVPHVSVLGAALVPHEV